MGAQPARQRTASTETAAVVFENRTLFLVSGGKGRISAGERAGLIQARLYRLAQNTTVPTSTIHIEDSDSETEILAGDDPLAVRTTMRNRSPNLERILPPSTLREFEPPLTRIATFIAGASAAWRSQYLIATSVLYLAIILLWRIRTHARSGIRRHFALRQRSSGFTA